MVERDLRILGCALACTGGRIGCCESKGRACVGPNMVCVCLVFGASIYARIRLLMIFRKFDIRDEVIARISYVGVKVPHNPFELTSRECRI